MNIQNALRIQIYNDVSKSSTLVIHLEGGLAKDKDGVAKDKKAAFTPNLILH